MTSGEIIAKLDKRMTTFSGFYNNCKLEYHRWGHPTYVTDCGRYNGVFATGIWNDGELRLRRLGQTEWVRLYFSVDASERAFVIDEQGKRSDLVASR